MKLTIKDILDITEGTLRSVEGTVDINRVLTGIATDTRKIGEDDLFVTFRGERVDAHKFIPQLGGKTAAILMDEDFGEKELLDASPAAGTAYIKVDDVLTALQKIGAAIRDGYTGPVIGVTGSVGKTTTREIITHVLSSSKKVFHTEGNNNSQIGVPLTLSRIMDEPSDMSVLEMGISEPGGMDKLTAMVRPQAAVVTVIGVAHMEFLKSKEGIRDEKLRIISRMNSDLQSKDCGVVFLNSDDPLLLDIKDKLPVKVYCYGTTDDADFKAENIRTEGIYSCFDLCYKDEKGSHRYSVRSSAFGKHNVLNASAALGVAAVFGLDMDKAVSSLESFNGSRQKLREYNGIFIIDDAYNASPDSMKAELEVLRGLDNKGRKIAVLGSMFELGDTSEELHAEVGSFAEKLNKEDPEKQIDMMVLVGEEAKAIGQNLDTIESHWFLTKEEAGEYLKSVVKSSDALLIKASNGMKLSYISELFS